MWATSVVFVSKATWTPADADIAPLIAPTRYALVASFVAASVVAAVLSAFTEPSEDEFGDAERLFRLSGMPMPAQIVGLKGRAERFPDVCDLGEMPAKVLECVE